MKPHEFSRAERDLKRVRHYLDDGQLDAAQAAAESLNRAFPALAIGWFWRSLVHLAQNQLVLAIAAAKRAIQLDDQRAEVHSHLARCYLARGDAFLALQSADKALKLAPASAAMLKGIAAVLSQCGEHQQALSLLDRAVELAPENAAVQLSRATALRHLKRDDAAEAAFEHILELAPRDAQAHWSLAQLRTWDEQNNHLERLQQAYARCRPDSIEAGLIDFASYKESEDVGAVASAGAALVRANHTLHGRMRFNGDADAKLFELLEAGAANLFELAASEPLAAPPNQAPVPIFVLGMPRSGTSLVERVLGNHPDVRLGGELQDFNVCIKRELGIEVSAFVDERVIARLGEADWQRVGGAYRARLLERFGSGGYVTDKLPGNFVYAAAIAAALPEARIVHMVREPLDNCFSIYRQMFGPVYPYAYHQELLADHYVRYANWMRRCESALPKRIFPLRYEQLASVPGLITRQLYRFCWLDWVEGAENPMQNNKPVGTASNVLIREPIHARCIGRWRNYSADLKPMRDVLAAAGLVPRD